MMKKCVYFLLDRLSSKMEYSSEYNSSSIWILAEFDTRSELEVPGINLSL